MKYFYLETNNNFSSFSFDVTREIENFYKFTIIAIPSNASV